LSIIYITIQFIWLSILDIGYDGSLSTENFV